MWELWIMLDFNYYMVYASNDLVNVRAVEYENAMQGGITEIRLNMEVIKQ